jgi:hypothetical protein
MGVSAFVLVTPLHLSCSIYSNTFSPLIPYFDFVVDFDFGIDHDCKLDPQVGNFIAGAAMQEEVEQRGRSVVVDRFYCSTMAYLWGKDTSTPLPPPLPPQASQSPESDPSNPLAWPQGLYRPQHMFYLVLPEPDRVARRQSRESEAETAEERLLRENPAIAQRINEAYELLGCTRVALDAADSVEVVAQKIMQLIHSPAPAAATA